MKKQAKREASTVDFGSRDAVYQQIARIGQTLANPTRLRLLGLLMQGEKPVELLAERSGQSVVNVSAQLKVLRDAHLVLTTRVGRQVRYRVESQAVEQLFLALRLVAERHLPEMRELVREYERDPESLSQYSGKELLSRVRSGEVLLLDLRPADEYATAHLEGARSVPFPELNRRIAELPTDREIIAYCRGPYCVMAVEGVRLLRRKGKRATRLPEGVLEWRARKLPVASSIQEANR